MSKYNISFSIDGFVKEASELILFNLKKTTTLMVNKIYEMNYENLNNIDDFEKFVYECYDDIPHLSQLNIPVYDILDKAIKDCWEINKREK